MTNKVVYSTSAFEKLDSLLESEFKISDDASDGRVATEIGINASYVTTNWSNINFLEMVISEYDVYVQKTPALKKQIDIFEFIAYCWLIVEQRLLVQPGMDFSNLISTRFCTTEAMLQYAILPSSVVLYLEQLAPKVTHEGTKLYFGPYEYRQQNGGAHNDLTPEYNMTAGVLSLRAARVLSLTTGQAVANAANAVAVRCNIWRLIQVAETVQAQTLTAQQMNDAIGYPVFTRSYDKRHGRINAIVQGRCSHAGTHFFNLYMLNGTLEMMIKDKHFIGFYATNWKSKLMDHTAVQTYDRNTGNYYYSIHFKRVSVICNPFIYTHDSRGNIAGSLDLLNLPRHVRFNATYGLSSYEKRLCIQNSLNSRDFSSLISTLSERYGPKMF